MNATVSFRAPQNMINQSGLLAEATVKIRNFLVVQAMRDFIEREAWPVQEMQDAIKEAATGDFATPEGVQEIKAKWSRNAG